MIRCTRRERINIVYIIIAGLILLLDLLIKGQIEKGKGTSIKAKKLQEKIFHNKIIIDKCHNFGAILNLGDKKPKIIKRISQVILACIILAFASALTKKKSFLYCFGMALLLGGSAGNLYDRMKRGYVVDYFRFNIGWKKLKQIVFNLADMFIILGAVIVLFEKMKE